MRMVSRVLCCAGCAAAMLAAGAPAFAQNSPPSNPHTPRWEVEAFGGFSFGRIPSDGTTTLPDAGAPITTSSPTSPSRQVPSWFFGDGSTLLNEVLENFSTQRLTPLDAALSSPGFTSGAAGAFGARVRRTLTRRLTAEANLTFLTDSPGLSSGFLSSVETTRASFETAMSALLSSAGFTGIHVAATAASASASGREIAATAGIDWFFGRRDRFEPYLTAGGGVLSGAGTAPSVTLNGDYSALFPNGGPLHETDHLVLRYTRAARLVAVVGAGVRRNMSDRWGLSLDARAFIGPNGVEGIVDATPTVATGTPSAAIESITAPSIQFSNSASTGRVSSLGAPALQGAVVFAGSGLQIRTLVTFGVFLKF